MNNSHLFTKHLIFLIAENSCFSFRRERIFLSGVTSNAYSWHDWTWVNDISHQLSVYRFEWAWNTALNIKRISFFYIKHLFPKCITPNSYIRWILNAKLVSFDEKFSPCSTKMSVLICLMVLSAQMKGVNSTQVIIVKQTFVIALIDILMLNSAVFLTGKTAFG